MGFGIGGAPELVVNYLRRDAWLEAQACPPPRASVAVELLLRLTADQAMAASSEWKSAAKWTGRLNEIPRMG